MSSRFARETPGAAVPSLEQAIAAVAELAGISATTEFSRRLMAWIDTIHVSVSERQSPDIKTFFDATTAAATQLDNALAAHEKRFALGAAAQLRPSRCFKYNSCSDCNMRKLGRILRPRSKRSQPAIPPIGWLNNSGVWLS
jgi:hypothetical protein